MQRYSFFARRLTPLDKCCTPQIQMDNNILQDTCDTSWNLRDNNNRQDTCGTRWSNSRLGTGLPDMTSILMHRSRYTGLLGTMKGSKTPTDNSNRRGTNYKTSVCAPTPTGTAPPDMIRTKLRINILQNYIYQRM